MKRRTAGLVAGLFVLGSGAWWVRSSRPGNPLNDPTVRPERATFSGHVVQRLNAGSYVYLQLRSPSGADTRWVVTLASASALASELTATLYAQADHFHSARLGRDFSPLHFASVTPQHPVTEPERLSP